MFKLQRLEITGFKSFADYTEIIFTGDGITAIVGPNGCGKSNVADAITWAVTRPSHVNVDLLVLRPRAQASNTKVHREL